MSLGFMKHLYVFVVSVNENNKNIRLKSTESAQPLYSIQVSKCIESLPSKLSPKYKLVVHK